MKPFKRKYEALAIAVALAAGFTACTNGDDNIDEPQQPAEPKTYTLTINASKGDDAATTRALSLSGSTLNATWATTENVYVMKVLRSSTGSGETANPGSQSTSTPTWAFGWLQPQSDGAVATLTGTLSFSNSTIKANDKLTLQFPRSGDLDYRGQDGTLETIASTYDYAIATIQVESVDVSGNDCSNITPKTNPVAFRNQQAIVRFTLQDKNGNAINPTELTVSNVNPEVKYNEEGMLGLVSFGTLTITPSGSTNVVYAALRGVNGFYAITLTAKVGNDTYTYSKSGVTFTHGKFYDITVKMEKQ